MSAGHAPSHHRKTPRRKPSGDHAPGRQQLAQSFPSPVHNNTELQQQVTAASSSSATAAAAAAVARCTQPLFTRHGGAARHGSDSGL